MNGGPTVEFKVQFDQRRKGRKSKVKPTPPPRVPRIAKTMALAIQMQQLIRDGVVKDQAELAKIGGVTRARVTQIMNLRCLAPEIQEAILLLEPTTRGRDAVRERDLRQVVAETDWRKQREAWSTLKR
jgi:predicted XRE-type DNA-binding protein